MVRILQGDAADNLVTGLDLQEIGRGHPEADLALNDTTQQSITPRTHTERRVSDGEHWFVDKYEVNGNQLLRFGLYTERLQFSADDRRLEGAPENFIYDGDRDTLRSSRFGAIEAANVHCNPVEVALIQNAVNYLLDGNQRTVLVDILVRHKGQVVYKHDDGHEVLDIHTVVLYKNPAANGTHTISVIDPNNFVFSGHLQSLTNPDVPEEYRVIHDLLTGVRALYKELKIYTPPNADNPGTGHDQSRNCTDIAVKLALNFNLLPDDAELELTARAIKEHHVVKMISNNTDIDKTIIDDDAIVRVKQSSNTTIVAVFHTICTALKSGFDGILKNVMPAEYQVRQTAFTSLVDQPRDGDEQAHYQGILHHLVPFHERLYGDAIAYLQHQQANEQADLMAILGDLE